MVSVAFRAMAVSVAKETLMDQHSRSVDTSRYAWNHSSAVCSCPAQECPDEIWYFPGRANLNQCCMCNCVNTHDLFFLPACLPHMSLVSSRVTLGNGTIAVGAVPFLLPGFGGWFEATVRSQDPLPCTASLIEYPIPLSSGSWRPI